MPLLEADSALREAMPPEEGGRRDVDPQLLHDAQAYLECRSRRVAPGPALEAAWDSFCEQQLPFLRDVARAARGAALEPDEANQEAWVALLGGLGGHRQDWGRGQFRCWLFVVARNHLSGLGRRAARRRTSPLVAAAAASIPGTEDDPAVALDRELDRELVRGILAELRTQVSEVNYRVIHLRWVEGRTIAEVAAALLITPEQVRFRHHRLMKKLRVLAGRRGRGN